MEERLRDVPMSMQTARSCGGTLKQSLRDGRWEFQYGSMGNGNGRLIFLGGCGISCRTGGSTRRGGSGRITFSVGGLPRDGTVSMMRVSTCANAILGTANNKYMYFIVVFQ